MPPEDDYQDEDEAEEDGEEFSTSNDALRAKSGRFPGLP